MAGADRGIYDPEQAVRGQMGKYADDASEDSDSCGMWERGHVSLLGLSTDQGFKNIPYHGIDGIDQDNPKDCRWFEINCHAVLDMVDENGEVKKRAGDFAVRVEGQRLESIIRQVRVGRRVTIHPSGPVDDPKRSQVDRIWIRGVAPEPVEEDYPRKDTC